MKGDFSRITFDRRRSFSGVRFQQGRVTLDADLNEAADIQQHIDRTARIDQLGRAAAPRDGGGFALSTDGARITVGPGRFWLDGLLVENDAPTSLDAQPWLPGAALPSEDGVYAVVLTARERLVTALMDPSLREVALGGPDHAARTQVVWQVRLLRIAEPDAPMDCERALETEAWRAFTAGSTGRMRARLRPGDDDLDPCSVPRVAGYRGLDNQLYRVEVHEGTHRLVHGVFRRVSDAPTVKFSRENGSVVTSWVGPGAVPREVVVSSVGPDDRLGFAAGDLVELTGDAHELGRTPGALRALDAVDPDERVFRLDADAPARASVGTAPRIHRWEGVLPVKGTYQDLERGIQVRFDASGVYQTGDWWLVPARALTGSIEWSPDAQRPHGPVEHHALIGLARRAGTWSVEDHRRLFPALTALRRLTPLGGDGQAPDHRGWAPRSLRVGASDGTAPLSGVSVRFTPLTGRLSVEGPGGAAVAAPVEVPTGPDGVAEVWWQVVDGPLRVEDRPEVRAELLGCDGEPLGLPARFIAETDLRLSYAGGDGQDGRPGEPLDQPLRARVMAGGLGVAGAVVEFALVDPGQGELGAHTGDIVGVGTHDGRQARLRVQTDDQGDAAVRWTLGTAPSAPRQAVTATLLTGDEPAPTSDRIVYAGTIRRARDTRYDARCRNLASAKTVAEALDRLCGNAGLHYVSGDGQQGRAGTVLPLSLRVRVANGQWPREGAFVRFEVLNTMAWDRPLGPDASGTVKGWNPVPWGRGKPGPEAVWSTSYVVRTDARGLAQAQWRLGREPRLGLQRVRATLLDDDRRPTDLSITFSAAITSSEPIVAYVGRHGREAEVAAGTVLPTNGFLGLRFRDLLTHVPPEDTHPMQWWPGVRITIQVPEEQLPPYARELVIPGRCLPQPDGSLVWTHLEPRGAGNAVGAAMGTNVSPTPLRLTHLSGAATTDRGAATPAEALRFALHDARMPDPPLVAAPVGATAAAFDQRYLLRVRLVPRFFPDRCAGRAADFETFFWLDPSAEWAG